ncbi:hypothetical protein [Thermococcus sp. Bubb.Bath]|uniref:hypothetical protein n=1 Tax=Thermococcus sp. Bubb.Bath TaxID=1638242 RepID=UPI001439B76B|nr:hypothetical protein [Thermococcus sp. Bubb.Bath]NJF25560.1 hypothetical protein [Thermococcus sp. Bubb.Bath]
MDSNGGLKDSVAKILLSSKTLAIVDRDVSSFTYLDALAGIGKPLEMGRYAWIVSYEPLQSLLRDLRRAGIDYERYLNRNMFILDVFGSIKHIDSGIDGVFVLGGYLDDRVFIIKYKSLTEHLLSEISPPTGSIMVVGYLESGMCRLFDNPVRTHRLLWNLREEFGLDVSSLITYIKPECPALEEFVYLYSDFVVEGCTDGDSKCMTVTKGELE